MDIEFIINHDPELNRIAGQILSAYREKMVEKDAIASGSLSSSATYIIDAEEGHVTLYFYLNYYWYYLEFGPRQHFPPVAAIEKWIEQKGIVGKAKGGKGKAPNAKQLAFAICKSMERGKTNIDGRRVAYIAKPALRETIEADNAGLIEKFVNRVCEIYAEVMHQQIDVALNSLNDKTTPVQDFFLKQMR